MRYCSAGTPDTLVASHVAHAVAPTAMDASDLNDRETVKDAAIVPHDPTDEQRLHGLLPLANGGR